MTAADRDQLAAYFHGEVDECQFHNEPGHTPECERAADRFLDSDWLAALIEREHGKAVAPILALADRICTAPDCACIAKDIRAAGDPAAATTHDRAVAAQALRAAADDFDREGLSLKDGGWGSNPADQQTIQFAVRVKGWLRDRADALDQENNQMSERGRPADKRTGMASAGEPPPEGMPVPPLSTVPIPDEATIETFRQILDQHRYYPHPITTGHTAPSNVAPWRCQCGVESHNWHERQIHLATALAAAAPILAEAYFDEGAVAGMAREDGDLPENPYRTE